ncbi:MAG TPA: kinase [Mycobacteriales bacterium]
MPDDAPMGSPHTTLVVIRGNSGSGKSSVARALQLRYGRGCALVEQDYLRRTVLRERDIAGGLAPELIAQTVRFALDHHYHTVLEGILLSGRYSTMLASLHRSHRGQTFFYYLDVSLEETVRRHATRPQATEFSPDDMRGWYERRDLLGFDGEHVIPETSSLEETVTYIAETSGFTLRSVAAADAR